MFSKYFRCVVFVYLTGSSFACGDTEDSNHGNGNTSTALAAYDEANEHLGVASCDCQLAAGSTPSMEQCMQSWRAGGYDACERAVLNEPETADWLECYTQELLDKAECLEQSCANDCYLIVLDCPWTSDIAEALGACK